jgi:hypothetical protein
MVTASPRVYLLQQLLSFGDGYASLENARGAAMVELLFITQQNERLGAPSLSPSFGLVEGQLSSEEIFQVRACQFGFSVTPFRSSLMRRASPSAAEGTSGWTEASLGSCMSSILMEG